MEAVDVVCPECCSIDLHGEGSLQRTNCRNGSRIFVYGKWSHLIDDGRICAEQSSKIATRKRRRGQHDDVERRAARVQALVQMGELSAGRQALEGEALAPGNEHTLHQLQRRPAVPRHQMPEDLERFWPGRRFESDEKQFSQNMRSFRRGAVAGPSGTTAEHLWALLNAPRILHLLFRASESLAARREGTKASPGPRCRTPTTRARVGRGRRSTLSVAGSCSDAGSHSATCTRGSNRQTQRHKSNCCNKW